MPVTVPAQLSVVVGAARMVAEHWPVTSGKLPVCAGAIVSCDHDVLRLGGLVAIAIVEMPSHHRGALRRMRERVGRRAGDRAAAIVRRRRWPR